MGRSWLPSEFSLNQNPDRTPNVNIGPGPVVLFVLIILALVPALSGCGPAGTGTDAELKRLETIIQDGIEIPRFSTAQYQLNYGRSGFTDRRKKQAALRAVHTLFPEDRLERGNADLDLAYLCLEPDYRLANPAEITRAAFGFRAVLDQYPDIPDVQAKAHWYMGWIHADLKKDLAKGLYHYWAIVQDFPKVTMDLVPPAPWTSLVYPSKTAKNPDLPVSTEKYWAAGALLEIIRHAPRPMDAIQAFDLLYEQYFVSTETRAALKLMLSTPVLADHVRPKVKTVLSSMGANPYLAREIRELANFWEKRADPADQHSQKDRP